MLASIFKLFERGRGIAHFFIQMAAIYASLSQMQRIETNLCTCRALTGKSCIADKTIQAGFSGKGGQHYVT